MRVVVNDVRWNAVAKVTGLNMDHVSEVEGDEIPKVMELTTELLHKYLKRQSLRERENARVMITINAVPNPNSRYQPKE